MTSEVESQDTCCCSDIRMFVRNRYFYGKLLDVSQFELEQDYFNEKRWLLNRIVTGWGVVCGLSVGLTEDMKGVWVDPGIAIDKCGREILVPVRSKPVPIPEATPSDGSRDTRGDGDRGDDEREHDHATGSLWICYHECPCDPVPISSGDCEDAPVCSNGSIRERYTLELRPCRAPHIHTMCELPDVIVGGKLNYKALAIYVTNSDCNPKGDCCIPLANIHLPSPGKTACDEDIDITVRPIVYTNDLLFELMLGLTSHFHNRLKGGKG